MDFNWRASLLLVLGPWFVSTAGFPSSFLPVDNNVSKPKHIRQSLHDPSQADNWEALIHYYLYKQQ